MLNGKWAPTCLLYTTDSVHQSMAVDNGLHHACQLIQPHASTQHGLNVQRSDAQGASYTIAEMPVRFQSVLVRPTASGLQQMAQHVAMPHSPTAIALTAPADLVVHTPADAERYQHVDVDQFTPRFAQFRAEFFGRFSVSAHETFHHPVAIVYAVSASTPRALEVLAQMQSLPLPPALYDSTYVAMDVLRYYLVVHDARSHQMSDSEALLADVKKSFGLHCHLLSVNSAVASSPDISELYRNCYKDQLTSTKTAPVSPLLVDVDVPTEESVVNYAQWMSDKDLKNIRNFLKALTCQSLVPFMERNVNLWNEQVAAGRRGLTGRLFQAGKKYFGTSSSKPSNARHIQVPSQSDPGTSVSTIIYPASSPEAILRKLADYAFMLQDYRFAQSIYESVKRDYQAERAYKYYAGVQEMIGLCSLRLNDRKDVESYCDSAMSTYADQGYQDYAFRTTLLYYEHCIGANEFRDAAKILLRLIPESEPARSAMFYEQTAYLCLKLSPPLVRKYSFYLYLAGQNYLDAAAENSNSDTNYTADVTRCFQRAESVYGDKHWSMIDDTLNFVIGQQMLSRGEWLAATEHFVRLLRASSHPVETQKNYLQKYMEAYQKYDSSQIAKGAVVPLPLPEIHASSLKIISEVANDAGPVGTGDDSTDRMWGAMERELVEEYSLSHSVKQTDFSSNRHVFAVKEPVTIALTLVNPLQISLNLSRVRLDCVFAAAAKELPTQSTLSSLDVPVDGWVMADGMKLEDIGKLTLMPLEKRILKLRLVPERAGVVRILGLLYLLNDAVSAKNVFIRRGKRLNDTMEQRTTQAYAEDKSFDLQILPPMPLLDLKWVGPPPPTTIYSGEVVRLNLRLFNRGEKVLDKLYLRLSHPGFFHFGSPSDASLDCYSPIATGEQAVTSNNESMTAANKLTDTTMMALTLRKDINSDDTLAAGASIVIPVWMRGDKIGDHDFTFLFAYHAGMPANKIPGPYRVFRFQSSVSVEPSLKINAFTRPSSGRLGEFILGVEVENLQTTHQTFSMTQLSSLSPSWQLQPLGPESLLSESDFTLAEQETTFIYYRLIKLTGQQEHETPEAFTEKSLRALISGEPLVRVTVPPIKLNAAHIGLSAGNLYSCQSQPIFGLSQTMRIQWRKTNLATIYPAIPASKIPSTFTAYQTDDVDLVALWKTGDGTSTRRGHHYIVGINLGVQQAPIEMSPAQIKALGRSLYAQTEREKSALLNNVLKNRHIREENPVKLMMHCPETVPYNFSPNTGEIQQFLTVPVKIELHNCSRNRAADFVLELLPAGLTVDGVVDFQWVGVCTIHGRLEPREQTMIDCGVAIVQPGVYNLNRWSLTVTVGTTRTFTLLPTVAPYICKVVQEVIAR